MEKEDCREDFSNPSNERKSTDADSVFHTISDSHCAIEDDLMSDIGENEDDDVDAVDMVLDLQLPFYMCLEEFVLRKDFGEDDFLAIYEPSFSQGRAG